MVGEAADGPEAVRLCTDLQPEILIADSAMPKLNGIEVAGRVQKLDPPPQLIILSMHSDESYILRALAALAAAEHHERRRLAARGVSQAHAWRYAPAWRRPTIGRVTRSSPREPLISILRRLAASSWSLAILTVTLAAALVMVGWFDLASHVVAMPQVFGLHRRYERRAG